MRFAPVILLFLLLGCVADEVPVSSESNLTVWANDGGDKVAKDEMRATRNASSTINSVWNGTGIDLFGARNEVVSFNLVLEASGDADDINVSLPSLSGPGGEISGRQGGDIFNYSGRDIDLFYVRYLEIEGLSTDLFYDHYDERHTPERCRLPYDEDFEAQGTFGQRPCADRLYPEIAVPLELHSPFDISHGTSQSIWGDIYIPKGTAPGNYSGTITVSEHGIMTHRIPVTLRVRNFTLPDIPSAKTMLAISHENIGDRYLGGEGDPSAIIDKHFQLAHRHKISLIGNPDGYTEVEDMASWEPALDGSLFTEEEGYGGIGEGVGNNVYAIGEYGSWPWQGGTEQDMWSHSDSWVLYFENRSFRTPTDYFLYLIDESDDYGQIQEWARWIETNPGPGSRLMSMATLPLPEAEHVPSLDIPASWVTVGITDEWEDASKGYINRTGKRLYLYNSNRPASGSFAIEDDGIALRELAWGQHKKGVDRWFYWESTYYLNFQCYGYSDERAYTDVFTQAQTYGCYDSDDSSLGRTGWNYVNGDGVLFYPGTDTRFIDESYGVPGPFASLRMKHWRRGIQDADYLALASEADPEATDAIVRRMVPKALWEYGVSDIEDPSYVLSDISWSNDPDDWEEARSELADIIESASAG